ncbi:D-alanyl-D-alanine carboxypeptidase [Desulfallas sp. Bu1-1]|uniref:D-alanyl-D-alanine carboxypeptidase family protein n=1 Tax=Desulfallas sp. Bu1-1 TaxID=2787620 RepID=UPI00189CB964|nr:D-alanyl-D-alanine carboxypeptidase family protein [Desulfallas sp. Bu1-1]MBF7083919.1 D-alanyl-D-alanine carboxypeptidase [Desulfallas sp. Bu1-1]
MLKKNLIILLVLFLACYIGETAKSEASNFDVNARAAILMDAETGQVYYAKNAGQQRSPASLTKLMTAILAVENGKLDDVVEVSGRAASISVGSTIGLNKGDRITLENLLKAALITSANDSTVAIAEHVGGNHDAFIYQMNRKALLLGAKDTRFANTNGYYDPQHYTTAYDLGLITRYALQKPLINELVSTREDVIKWVEPEREKEVRNTNRLLFSDEVAGIDGVKTGSTPRAGNCLIASATRGDMRLIAVVLHAGNRYREAAKLIEYGFEEVRPVVIFPAGRHLGKVKVRNGTEAVVPVTVLDPVRVKIAKGQLKNIRLQVKLNDTISAPVREGQMLGHALFTINGYRLIKVPLVAAREVPPARLFPRILYWLSG